MHVIVVHHPKDASTAQVQSLADALGITAFDARQRLVCPSPVVVSVLADRQQAQKPLCELRRSGLEAFLVDVEAALSQRPVFVVRSFSFADNVMHVRDGQGRDAAIGNQEIKLILSATQMRGQTEVQTVTERKFSVGRTLMAGGLPLSKKTTRQETLAVEEREQVLYLCSGKGSRLICARDRMTYEGFGDAMKPSREMNHNLFVNRVRQRCPEALYDDRLMRRAAQVQLLGPLLDPDRYLELAVDILLTTLVLRRE
ncbi:MAG: hypothetical protein P8Y84_11530 [Desulfuromonadales bacterium]|jgi:hypothetical protein